MKPTLVAVLLALSAGVALAGDVTPYDKELAAQALFPTKATPKAGATQTAAPATATPCICKR